MGPNKLLIFFLLSVTASYSQRERGIFRKDYKYINTTESFYKIHTIRKTWEDARDVCEVEGALLYYPENKAEEEAVRKYWEEKHPVFDSVYVGISSLIFQGVFETVDGRPVNDVYANWAPGEPNDANGNEDCVIVRKDGTFNDVICNGKNPFICKKSLSSLDWNTQCDMPNPDYVYQTYLGKCYKLHLQPKTWPEAYATCFAEQSYLAIIDSQAEADYLSNITLESIKNCPYSVPTGEAVCLGFQKRRTGWATSKGVKLEHCGYSKWGEQQPNADNREICGAMFYNGFLQNIRCDVKCIFICEHDVGSLSISNDDRFVDVI